MVFDSVFGKNRINGPRRDVNSAYNFSVCQQSNDENTRNVPQWKTKSFGVYRKVTT